MLKNLRKLLKYEFRFYFRILPTLYLGLVLVALFAGFQSKQSEWLYLLLVFICFAMFFTMTIIHIVLIIQRFRDNFMKNPGYLMFTLPVTVWTLMASKVIAAICMALMSAISILVSALAYCIVSKSWAIIDFFPPELWANINLNMNIKPADIIIFVIFVSIQMLQSICLIYAIISASYILPKFRFVAGAVMYLIITNFINQPVFRSLERYTASFSISYSFILYNLLSLAFAALFFWAAGFLLKHRLNLE